MIISSKINDSKWIWVKIPKTGTRAYSKLLVPHGGDEIIQDGDRFFHFHKTFNEIYVQHQKQYSGFTVVRHPITRFISALNHLADLNSQCTEIDCVNHPGKMPWDTIDNMANFLVENFHKNCHPKNDKSLGDIFGVEFYNYYASFFKTQTYWAYHPKMKWFRYEELDVFNAWLETELGFDTTKIERVGEIKKKHLTHLDFNTPVFRELVEHLFYDDFQLFNY